MNTTAYILITIVAVEHFCILLIEMFAWETIGKKIFKSLPEALFTPTKGLAANQGLYNGFLAVGLLWSMFIEPVEWQRNVAVFFLCCVVIAGIYGAASASKKIFFIQALPALLALAAVILV